MRKSVLAVVALGGAAVAALPVSAQDVTLYGVMDAFVEFGKANQSQTRLESGGANGSRFGLRGTEDLGNGLKVLFTMESGLFADTGNQASASTMWNRQAFVGLRGPFGTVTMGRQYSPLLSAQDRNDSALSTTGYGSPYNSGVMRTISRVNNSILYESPKWGDVSMSAMLGLGENTLGNKYGAIFSMAGRYNAGPVNVDLSYGRINATTTAATGSEAKSIVNLAGTYTFGSAQLMAAVQSTQNDSQQAATLDDRTEFLVGGTLRLGSGQIRAVYGQGKVNDVSQTTARHYSLGYVHDLSKRTAIYTVAQVIDNPTNLAYRTSGFTFDAVAGGLPAGAGVNARAVAVGVRHRF
jgi:predicted porin